MRGLDIHAAAVFLSFAIIKRDGFELFIDQSKVTESIRDSLVQDDCFIYNYNEIEKRLEMLVLILQEILLLALTTLESI